MYPHEEPLTAEQLSLLNTVYYANKSFVGYHRLFELVRAECEKQGVKHIYRQQLVKWLQDQEAYQLFKQPQQRVDTRSIYSTQVGGMLQIDSLVLGNDLKSSLRHTTVLNVIDVYSRYAWSFAQKSANAGETNANVEKVVAFLKEKGHTLSAVQTDNGTEFASLSKAVGDARHVTGPAGQPQRQAMIERYNKTMRDWLRRYAVSAKNPRQWFLDLDNFVALYNNSVHRGIKAKPLDVMNGTATPDTTDKEKTIDKDTEIPIPSYVRILDEKRTGIDKSQPLWSTEVYKVTKMKQGKDTRRNTYYVEGKNKYYNSTQLQVVTSNEPKTVAHTPNKVQSEPDWQPRRSARLAVKRVPVT